MNNVLKTILIFIFVANCSSNIKSKLWKEKKIVIDNRKVEEIFKKDEVINLEFNPSLKINLNSKSLIKKSINNYDNNGRVNYNGNLKEISKFKFSKIKKFYEYDPEMLFNNKSSIIFDGKGTIFKIDNNSKLIWEKNNYSKVEKKDYPILFFANNKETLIVADNIGKYYAIDLNTGNLLWSKYNTAPFNSQIKIYKDKFFLIDFDNILRAYFINNGKETWNIKTESALIRSQKKLSMVIANKKIFFNNSLGDISAVNINSGELLWQSPTQSSLFYNENYFLKTSNIIFDKNTLYFSNNKNQFFALNINTGALNWEQKINSNLRSTLISDYIFAVTLEGYLVIIEKNSGNIIRVTDSFKNFKDKVRNTIEPTGFIVGNNNIYLATDHGRLLTIDITTGKVLKIAKVGKNKILRPLAINDNLFITTEKSVIKLN